MKNLRRRDVMAGLLCLLLQAGCAKTGEPRPPQLLIPRPAAQIGLRQLADRIELRIPLPTENMDGSPVTTLDEVEIFRMAGPKEGKPSATEEAFLAGGSRILTLSGPSLAARSRDGEVRVQDPLPGAGGAAAEGRGYYYAVRFINRKYQTAGLSPYAFIAPVSIPEAPGGLAGTVEPERILLTWERPERNSDGSEPARVAGFNIYRAENPEGFPDRPLNAQPLEGAEFADRDFRFGKTYYYAVSVVGSVRDPVAESLPSGPVAVPARDTFAPGAPGGLDAVLTGEAVTLLWIAPPDSDLEGFRVFRVDEVSATKVLLGGGIVRVPNYRDAGIRPGAKYRYEIIAVDGSGNESPAAVVRVEVP